ncbi:MAG: ribbon-helix-helix protein, CopG family [Chloroflexota bacterium]|nr:ribbon-helix-helix protein, CopG family [Chloroflexota bacterium]
MEKTTVYLPKDLKKRLRAGARDRGVSEAQLIREGLEAVLAPRPTFPLFSNGTIAGRVDELLEDMGLDSLPPEMRRRWERKRPVGSNPARTR